MLKTALPVITWRCCSFQNGHIEGRNRPANLHYSASACGRSAQRLRASLLQDVYSRESVTRGSVTGRGYAKEGGTEAPHNGRFQGFKRRRRSGPRSRRFASQSGLCF